MKQPVLRLGVNYFFTPDQVGLERIFFSLRNEITLYPVLKGVLQHYVTNIQKKPKIKKKKKSGAVQIIFYRSYKYVL